MAAGRGGQVLVRMVRIVGPSLPFAAAWTAVLPLLSFRPPRPRLRRILGRPGTTACLAALVGLGWALAGLGGTLGVTRLVDGKPLNGNWLFQFIVEELFAYVGLAVAAAWFAQAIVGRFRPVPDWLHRFGRALGVYWIVVGLAWACRRYLAMAFW